MSSPLRGSSNNDNNAVNGNGNGSSTPPRSRRTTSPFLLVVIVLSLVVLANLYQMIVLDLRHGSTTTSSLYYELWNNYVDVDVDVVDNYNNSQRQHHQSLHSVGGLSCQTHGGPYDTSKVEQMVYWHDIPQDASFRSPLMAPREQFLTFEPDEGGWNNIRMSMETAVVLALATGRTLVLPPTQKYYLLWEPHPTKNTTRKDTLFGFLDFFHFESLHQEGLKVITFEQFLVQQAMQGRLKSVQTGEVIFPPDNRTDWTGFASNWVSAKKGHGKTLWTWMRRHAAMDAKYDPDDCVAAFPSKRHDNASLQLLTQAVHDVYDRKNLEAYGSSWRKRLEKLKDNPTHVNASITDRLAEILASRKKLCLYNETYQDAPVLHLKGEERTGHRLLIHFYAFVFLSDWKHDLWMKRFVRDHLRYRDEIQCAAARVVAAVQEIAQQHNGDQSASFDTFHIRRGDFQYQDQRLSAEEVYLNNTQFMIEEGRLVYVATDVKDRDYFKPLSEHYRLVFLNDFLDVMGRDFNPNFYGMVDQLVASMGEVFVGTYYSTFSAYINRLRGYREQNARRPGWYELGKINSYYAVPDKHKRRRETMQHYTPLQPGFWEQEYPIGWRGIDFGVEEETAES